MMKSSVPVFAAFVLVLLVSLFTAGCVSPTASSAQSRRYFDEITAIPRPSGNLAAFQSYLAAFAGKNGLAYEKDTVGNIRILHPGASADRPHIILQAHQDMVPAVREGSSFVFGTDTITTRVTDGWISAQDTTLGADDGAGMSVALAALVSPELQDYRFDAIFTADEETDMSGAMQLSPDWLDAEYLLNLDHGTLDELCISCAGGVDVEAVFSPKREPASGSPAYRLEVSGLRSGHSGLQIDAGRLNAILTAAAFLSTLHDVRIVSCTGGSAKNSIPGTASVVFTASDCDVQACAAAFVHEHAVATDPDLQMDIAQVQTPDERWTAASTRTFLDLLTAMPNGCFEKNDLGPRASANLGMIREEEDGTVRLVSFIRANEEARLDFYLAMILDTYTAVGITPTVGGRFSGWTSPSDDSLVSAAVALYTELFGTVPVLYSTHGGLECGYMIEKNPDLSIISIGPDIENEHSPDERMNVESFHKFTAYVFALVAYLGTDS